MKFYWDRHLIIDVAASAFFTVIAWWLPNLGLESLLRISTANFGDLCSRWLAACLTLLGLITATTGFLSTTMEKPEFALLAKSSSIAQLWETLRENLLWLFVAAIFCFLGSFLVTSSLAFQWIVFAGNFIAIVVAISLWKLVWVMRSVLFVKIQIAKNGN